MINSRSCPPNAESVEASAAAKAFDNSGALPAFVVWATDAATTPQQLASWQQVAPWRCPPGRSTLRNRTWARSATTCDPDRCR